MIYVMIVIIELMNNKFNYNLINTQIKNINKMVNVDENKCTSLIEEYIDHHET